MDAHELARWTRFAAKGGIGKCTATVDCIAQEMGEDLMFLKDDEITVLMQLSDPGVYLGHCEGVVGRFSGKDVRFHGKLKKPVMAKRGSVHADTSEPRTSISLVERVGSRTEVHKERPRQASQLPSNSRPGSRAKRTPSPPNSKTHASMQSYSTSYSRFSEDSPGVSRSTTVVGTLHTPTVKGSRASSIKSSHVKPPQMATSVSGASIFSVGSASVYSEASTATSIYSAADDASERPRSRNGSTYSVSSVETEKDVPGESEYGKVDQANGGGPLAAASVSMSDTVFSPTPPVSAVASKTMPSTSVSYSSLISASSSTSDATSLGTTSTGLGSIGSISELETKQFDVSKFDLHAETPPGFVLAPPPLGIGEGRNGIASVAVAPLRVSKSPRLTPSPGFPPLSPLPAPPTSSVENPRSTAISPPLRSPLSLGIPGSLSPRPPPPASLGFPASLSPGLPGSLAPGPRSPGLPGSLSPGFRSPASLHAQSQYTFSSGSSSDSPTSRSPFTSSYVSTPPSSLSSPYTTVSFSGNGAVTPPNSRSPPLFAPPYGVGHPCSAPLSPPPSSPLPPLPSTPLSSPAFPAAQRTPPSTLPAADTAATAAASGRASPLTVLSSSLPSSASGTLRLADRHGRHDEDGVGEGREVDRWNEVEEGSPMRLSTLDAFRRQLDDTADEDEIGSEGHSEDEEGVLRVCELKDEKASRTNGSERREEEEDAYSDGEVGIGLSLMAALGESDEEEDHDGAVPTRNHGAANESGLDRGDAMVGIDGKASGVSGEISGTTSIPWTCYTPTSPISVQSSNGYRRNGEEEGGGGNEEEDEDDGAYWDDIYDDYRYSRYSLASKRFSVASKGSGMSKTSSRARVNAPPMPVPPDRRSSDATRPSMGSDGTNGHPRPSFESSSSSMSASMSFARPSMARSASEESTHETHVLPLTSQFPAVPAHVPVRAESRLRIVHDGYMLVGEDRGERELEVVHGSTAKDVGKVGLNIEVIEAVEEDNGQGQEVDVRGAFTSPNTHSALSPLLHTTFGSPHSSRFTDLEDGSDQDHGRRYSNKSGKSMMSSAEGPPKSPVASGGIASALRANLDAERTPSSESASPTVVLAPDPASSEEPSVRTIVMDDEDGHETGINTMVDEPILATEAASPLPASSTQIPNTVQVMVATDVAQRTPSTDRHDGAAKSPFLRPRPQPNLSPHPFARTSIFLPHPNAPKAAYHSQGPMYGRMNPQAYSYPVPSEPGAGNAVHPPTPPGTTFYSTHILHQLRSLSIMGPPGPTRRAPLTLFARCQPDLSASTGPVPILFSLDPFPPLAMRPMGGGKGAPCPASAMPTRAATVSAPVRRGGGDGVPPSGAGTNAGTVDPSSMRLPKRSAATTAASVGGPQGTGTDAVPSLPLLPIPREGFVPQVGAARPRSRSFSAFSANVPVATPQEKSQEEPVRSVAAPPRKVSLPPALMPRHALSPLVLLSSNKDRTPNGSGSLGSPVTSSPALSTLPSSPFTQESLTYSPQSVDVTNGSLNSPIGSSPVDREKDMASKTPMSPLDPRSVALPQSLTPGRQRSLDVRPRSSSVEGPPRRSTDSGDSRSLASPPSIPEAASQSARTSPLVQELSLRTKLSLPALRVKPNARPKLDDAISLASFAGSGENETVQVQDMDFELVKPSLPQVAGRASQDSTVTSREADVGKPEASPVLCDAASMHSTAPKSPLAPVIATAPAESAESIDAHRQRELKWMALFPAVPASQARKNKKVRKLLQEGVPSSVRYLVWCHLTDSKARALPGVYEKLGKRPRVPAFAEIERDAVEGFPDQPQLHTTHGPLVSLLQAYLSMVPDIQYSNGLTYIAGHLLLLAPEEDAFWIFASMMDAHLRTYFSTNTIQIEIDASLFSKALEAIDPALTKKLYVQLSIPPASITRPWFSTLFVGSLSAEHLHRVWDIFLYDGIPYLFRVGLVVINCVRHLLLQANTEEAALALLARPPPACLPSANDLLSLAANMRLKDDDVRKQRVKMEQQLKRTTQVRPPNGMSNVQTATISLPKT